MTATVRRRTSKNLGRRVVREAIYTVLGVVSVGIIVFPVYWALCVAFQNDPDVLVKAPDLLPVHFVLSNFSAAWKAERGNIVTSLIISVSVVLIGAALAVPTAYGLKRFRVRYSGAVIGIMLITQMVPSIALSIAFYSLFRRTHLLNSYLGLILADSTYAVPLMTVLLRAFMESIPYEFFDAAVVDGATELRCLRSVIVPMALPGIMTAAIFGFLAAWGDFLFGLTLNSGGSIQPVTLGLYKFVGTYTTSWGPIMATVVLAALPAGVALSVGQRWIRGGLRAGALTG